MKIVLIGQQDFGKAALEAFLARGDEVVGVFCRPEKPGTKPDALRVEAQARGLQVFQLDTLTRDEAHQAMQALAPDLGVMAYVVQFAPQSLLNVPKHGTIQYHPSLLPKYRGPSAISWAMSRGEKETGLTIFRPSDGLDEGLVILQKRCDIGADETLGELYFNKLFQENGRGRLCTRPRFNCRSPSGLTIRYPCGTGHAGARNKRKFFSLHEETL